MAGSKANALVDAVAGLSSPPEALAARAGEPPPEFVTVSFQGGRSGRLDASSPQFAVWAEVLDSQRQAHLPVYVEIDPESEIITELLCPLTVHVGEITAPGEGQDVEVELTISQARHYLRGDQPNFAELLELLKDAQEKQTSVIVTETDDHQIIDVTPLSQLDLGGQE